MECYIQTREGVKREKAKETQCVRPATPSAEGSMQQQMAADFRRWAESLLTIQDYMCYRQQRCST